MAEGTNGNWKREIAVALLTALILAVGWAMIDRLHWSENERQIQINTVEIEQLARDKIGVKEHEDLKELINANNQERKANIEEIRVAISNLDKRFDNLLIALSGRERHKASLDPPPGVR